MTFSSKDPDLEYNIKINELDNNINQYKNLINELKTAVSQLTSSPTHNHEIYLNIRNISHAGEEVKYKIKHLFNQINSSSSTGVSKYNAAEDKLKSVFNNLNAYKNSMDAEKARYEHLISAHTDLSVSNKNLKLNLTSNYITYLFWIIIVIITFIITALSVLNPENITPELVIVYVIFISIIIYMTSLYFKF